MTGVKLFNHISSMTRINQSELRIMINKKEIYPDRNALLGWKKDCVINLKARLLGGKSGEGR